MKAQQLNHLNIALCQMTSVDNWQTNFDTIQNYLLKFDTNEPWDLFSAPEVCLFMAQDDSTRGESIELTDPRFKPLSQWAEKNRCAIHLGSVPLRLNNKVYNATVWINDRGEISTPYQKIHLFDVEISGNRSYSESKQFEYGVQPAILQYRGWKLGLSVCYDLRFSELYNYYARNNVDLILVPAAFTVPTGKAHWEVLLRARAIESQCFVLAAAQVGKHSEKRETYGHSLAIGPWGNVLVDGGTKTGLYLAKLDPAEISRTRAQIPMQFHRRSMEFYTK